jgi:hypothetical protein
MAILKFEPTRKLTQDQAIAGMLVGDLMTIPQLCRTAKGWVVEESDFWGGHREDAFILNGLPTHVLDFGGCQHVLINPKEFHIFMEAICSGDEEDEELRA